ncbi:MAG: (d)CMP kinase [Coriobacteriia bacterium]
MIIAIDGPAASGKSTVARTVAQRLGFGYLDTGAMYRSVALAALERSVPLDDEAQLSALARAVEVDFDLDASGLATIVLLDGRDVSSAIRSPEVTEAVSPVSKVPGVREAMVERQRRLCDGKDYVVEGRDIGTVVFPEADVKVYLTASVEERARRRFGDYSSAGVDADTEAVARELQRRDWIDSTRKAAPLAKADDAVLIDTTPLSVDEVVEAVLSLVDRS